MQMMFQWKFFNIPSLYNLCKIFYVSSRSPENGIQTVVHCATEPTLTEQSGFYYSDCAVQLTSENGSNMDDAYRLWELSERMAGLTSWFDPISHCCRFQTKSSSPWDEFLLYLLTLLKNGRSELKNVLEHIKCLFAVYKDYQETHFWH